MGRVYSVVYNGTITLSGGNTDLVSIQPGDDKPCRLLGMTFSQTSEIKDAEEEALRITVSRFPATFTVGSGGSAITAVVPLNDSLSAVWGATVRCNDTTVATTSGTIQTYVELGWNVRNTPFDFWFPDDRFYPTARQTEALVVRLESTVADDLTGSFTFFFEEPI
jgi:hypothetical protein